MEKEIDEILDIDNGGYCPDLDPSLDREEIADRKMLLDAAFGQNRRKKLVALKILNTKYGMTGFYRKGHEIINLKEEIKNGKR